MQAAAESIQTPRSISEVLLEYGAFTQDALKQYLPSGVPRQYLYDLVADYPSRGGKMMRPSLCIATARIFGGHRDDAVGTAVAIELFHNALLIHDDIEDGSEERRGRPTLHRLHGIPLALNAGDTLSLLSLKPLIDNVPKIGSRLALKILEETQQMAWESAEGQAMELGWRHDNSNDVSDADYLTMVLKKTCWLGMIYPTRVGALIGTRGTVDLEPFIRFGFFLGSAFQIQDDLLNFVADRRYGKEVDGDIWEGKRTLMLIHAYRKSSRKNQRRLSTILARTREERTMTDVGWIRKLMDDHRSVEYARAVAHGLAGAARHEFDRIFGDRPETRDKQFVRGLVTWVFERC